MCELALKIELELSRDAVFQRTSININQFNKSKMVQRCLFINRKWFSVVCTMIDNAICHHSGQNVVASRASRASVVYNFLAI